MKTRFLGAISSKMAASRILTLALQVILIFRYNQELNSQAVYCFECITEERFDMKRPNWQLDEIIHCNLPQIRLRKDGQTDRQNALKKMNTGIVGLPVLRRQTSWMAFFAYFSVSMSHFLCSINRSMGLVSFCTSMYDLLNDFWCQKDQPASSFRTLKLQYSIQSSVLEVSSQKDKYYFS